MIFFDKNFDFCLRDYILSQNKYKLLSSHEISYVQTQQRHMKFLCGKNGSLMEMILLLQIISLLAKIMKLQVVQFPESQQSKLIKVK